MKSVVVTVLVTFLAWVVVAIPALADHMNPDDMQVLIEFYKSTNGDGWVYKGGWLNSSTHNWQGVELNDEGRVTGLYLSYNGLSGFIPNSLGSLSQLTSLDLSNNQLSGTIPDSLGNLSQLTSLFLSNNQLSGAIPKSLTNMTKLSTLDISGNQFSGPIPESLTQLVQENSNRNSLGYAFLVLYLAAPLLFIGLLIIIWLQITKGA